MNWNPLDSNEKVEDINRKSNERPQLIFKHSTRCGISHSALTEMNDSWDFSSDVDLYYLDLLNYRDVSDFIASYFNVFHQSPQVILVQNGEVVGHWSHYSIKPSKIMEALS